MDLAQQSSVVSAMVQCTVAGVVLASSTADLAQVMSVDIRMMVAVAGAHSMTRQVVASSVVVDLSSGQLEQDLADLQLFAVVVHVMSDEMLLVAMLQ